MFLFFLSSLFHPSPLPSPICVCCYTIKLTLSHILTDTGIIIIHDVSFLGNDNASVSSDQGGRGQVRNNLLKKAKRKALRMSVFIVAAFMCCWFPYYVIYTGMAFGYWDKVDSAINTGLLTIGISNSMLNPIIYGAFQLCKVHKPRLVWRAVVSKPSAIDSIYLLVREGEKATLRIRPPILSLRVSSNS